MMMHTKESIAWMSKLREELAWLKAAHPDKTTLIAMGESELRTIEMASSTSFSSYPPDESAK